MKNLIIGKVRFIIKSAYIRAGVVTLTRLNEAHTDLVRAAGAEAASGRILKFPPAAEGG